MSWTLSAWAVGKGRHGEEQAIRIQMKRPDYSVNEEYALRAEASGLYAREYGAWPEGVGSSHEGEDGPGLKMTELEGGATSRPQ